MKKISLESTQILNGERGSVLVIAAILMFVLLGFGAFAIDFGYVYGIKNKLQNAADSAALAGASVLFSHNELCNSNGSPYSCCTGKETGTCVPGEVDVNNVKETAQALADLNNSGGSDTTVTVEIGHYAFASTWDSPGTFTAASGESTIYQMSGWEDKNFSNLNSNTNFINAVKVTVKREDVPRFFSRIWSSSDLSSTVQATAYIGFAGHFVPGEINFPMALCEDTLYPNGLGSDPVCTSATLYEKVETAMWTDLIQPDFVDEFKDKTCKAYKEDLEDAADNSIKNGNTYPIAVGYGVGVTNGGDTDVLKDHLIPAWEEATTDPNTGDRSSLIATLLVVECDDDNQCGKVKGAVEVEILWILKDKFNNNKEAEKAPYKYTYYGEGDAGERIEKTWSSSESDDKKRMEAFLTTVLEMDLEDIEKVTKNVFFRPTCKPAIPSGGTGGLNFGAMARYPKLVK